MRLFAICRDRVYSSRCERLDRWMHGCMVDGWVFFFSGRCLYGMAESLRTAGDTFGLLAGKEEKGGGGNVVLNKS